MGRAREERGGAQLFEHNRYLGQSSEKLHTYFKHKSTHPYMEKEAKCRSCTRVGVHNVREMAAEH